MTVDHQSCVVVGVVQKHRGGGSGRDPEARGGPSHKSRGKYRAPSNLINHEQTLSRLDQQHPRGLETVLLPRRWEGAVGTTLALGGCGRYHLGAGRVLQVPPWCWEGVAGTTQALGGWCRYHSGAG